LAPAWCSGTSLLFYSELKEWFRPVEPTDLTVEETVALVPHKKANSQNFNKLLLSRFQHTAILKGKRRNKVPIKFTEYRCKGSQTENTLL
jgi:hypothetical protein